jgi:pyridoxal phosphate enzyme (YggS family)
MICENIKRIQKNIDIATERSGRGADSVRLVAVSKRQDLEKIKKAASCGQQIFGENYMQEAQEKITILDQNLCWHFIGHLQSNKCRAAVELFDVIETVDRLKIARILARQAAELQKDIRILIQVNIGREKQKHGVLPENAENLMKSIKRETNLQAAGLMGMPPWSMEPEASRDYFRKLRKLSEQLADKGLFVNDNKIELSMGMSADYTIAIEEGATLVRVGTALFGHRD